LGVGWGPEEEIHGAVFSLDCGRGKEGKTLIAIRMQCDSYRCLPLWRGEGHRNQENRDCQLLTTLALRLQTFHGHTAFQVSVLEMLLLTVVVSH
jgi:hypothetical protein